MISVIIPSYNQQDYLSDAIESVLSTRDLPLELIIVDDGSTDNSLEIARKYEGIHVFHGSQTTVKVISQVNKGLAAARNTGIMNADQRADWILFLDADDMLLDGCVRKIREIAWSGTDADVIAPSLKTFGSSNETIILMPDPKLEDFKTGNRLGYCAAIRKSALLEVGGYSSRMAEGYEDLHLTVNLLAKGKKIVTILEVLWLYRTKKESMYTRITPQIHDKLIAQINKDVPEAKLAF